MDTGIKAFHPARQILVCIDSDGCAIDSMEAKHRECFGPLIVQFWGLQTIETAFLQRWNEINLYSATRGINRFRGLAMVLREFAVKGWQVVADWTERTSSLSNDALGREAAPELQRVLEWSNAVNQQIKRLPPPLAFPGVGQALARLAPVADIAIVSSANRTAILEEWRGNGLMKYVSVVLSQSEGTKSEGIRMLLDKGYEPCAALMLGDAPGDWAAARENGIAFYPILAGAETQSWKLFGSKVMKSFLEGKYNQKPYMAPFAERLNLGEM